MLKRHEVAGRVAEGGAGVALAATIPPALDGGAKTLHTVELAKELNEADKLNNTLAQADDPIKLPHELERYTEIQKDVVPELEKKVIEDIGNRMLYDVVHHTDMVTDKTLQADFDKLSYLVAEQEALNDIDKIQDPTARAEAEKKLWEALYTSRSNPDSPLVLEDTLRQETNNVANNSLHTVEGAIGGVGNAIANPGLVYHGTLEKLSENIADITKFGNTGDHVEMTVLAGGVALGSLALIVDAVRPHKDKEKDGHASSHGAVAMGEADGIRERLAGTRIYEVAGMSAGQLQNTVIQEAAKQAAHQKEMQEATVVRNQKAII